MVVKNSEMPKKICFLEQNIGYTFQKKEYVIEALRHSSYAN